MAQAGHRAGRPPATDGILERLVVRAIVPAPPSQALYSRRDREGEPRARREKRRPGPTAEGAKRSDAGAQLCERGRSGPDEATNAATCASARDGCQWQAKGLHCPPEGEGGESKPKLLPIFPTAFFPVLENFSPNKFYWYPVI